MRAPGITHPEGPRAGLSIPRVGARGGGGRACGLQPPACLAEPSQQQDLLKTLGFLLRNCYAKYWICVCAGMFIVVSFAGRLVVYKIVYMFLFLLCLSLFQVGGCQDPSRSLSPSLSLAWPR